MNAKLRFIISGWVSASGLTEYPLKQLEANGKATQIQVSFFQLLFPQVLLLYVHFEKPV